MNEITTATAESGPKVDESTSQQAPVKGEDLKPSEKETNLFDKGYGKGVNKGRTELLEELGTDNLEGVKQALKFKSDYEESQKSASEQVETLKTDNKDLKKQLKGYQERDKSDAEAVFAQLTEEQQASVTGSELPIEKLVSLMKTMLDAKPPVKKDIGSPFSPNTPEDTGPKFAAKSQGLDPEYVKDPEAYRQRHLAEVMKRHKQ